MGQNLKVLMIGSDRNILSSGSSVSERMKEYGRLVGELHIVLLSDSSHGLKETQLAKNVWVYPTNSLSKYLRHINAASIGKKIVYDKKFVRGESVITTQDPFEIGNAGLNIKKKWRIPLEVQLHTDPFSPYFSGLINNMRKNLAKNVLKNADSVRVVSEELKNKVSKYTNTNINVLPIYVDKETIENAQVSFDVHAKYHWKFVILTVARLTTEKNVGLAIEVLAKVRETYPDTGLIILGSGPEEGKLKSLSRKLGVDKNVAFEGWQIDLTSYYKTSNALLQTSLFEGYGMALVEAGLSGLPVVTTPVGIANELQHNKDAYIYHADKPELFVEGILDLINNNFKRDNLRMNLKRTLEQKLISKDEYMAKIKDNWEITAKKVKT